MKKTVRQRKAGWRGLLFLAAFMAIGMFWQISDVNAKTAEQVSGSYTVNGTFHIDQFGEYDINAEVTVVDNIITDVKVTGENFGGTYADYNQNVKLMEAISGMKGKFIGLSDTDAEGIQELDAVTGATYSSNGIKEAVLQALGLEQEEPSDKVPPQVPEAGVYDVTVAVRSDVVDHSLVQTDTAQAVLEVDENGQMKLSYTMVSGTEQEPMYILGINGYYVDNNRLGELSMDGVDYDTKEAGDCTVVTDVTWPLAGLSQVYYTNTRLYVPAMENLNGEISGIYFENGRFSVDTMITVYWDTLTKQGNDRMKITANVEEETSSPSFEVTVPSSIAMGSLSEIQDNLQAYVITVSAEKKEGRVTVTAPGGGDLKNAAGDTLPFYNDFGTKLFNAEDGSVLTETKASGMNAAEEVSLNGNILIRAKDVASAASGNYSGTTTFTISYNDGTEEPVDPAPSPTPTPDVRPTSGPTPTPDVRPTSGPTPTPDVRPTSGPTPTPDSDPTSGPTPTPSLSAASGSGSLTSGGASLKSGGGASEASGAETGDETEFSSLWLLVLAGGVLAYCSVKMKDGRKN